MTMELRRQSGVKAGFILQAARRSIDAGERRRVSPLLETLESRRLLTSSVSEIAVPSGIHAGPAGIAAGPGNSLWFTEYNSDAVGVIDASTHKITEFPLPTKNAQPWAITEGPDGNMWFTESGAGQIGMINVTTHVITEYPLSSYYAFPYGITAGPAGTNTVWFTEQASNAIGMINIGTGKVTEFPITTPDSVPEGITLGPDNNIWFTESLGNQIGVIDPTTHVISELGGLTAGSQPDGITVGSDGSLWFTEYAGNRIGTIDPATHAVSEFSVPTTNSRPDDITAGPNGLLWFTEYAGSNIGTINTSTHHISEISVPTAGSQPVGIVAGPQKTVWFGELHSGNLGIVGPALHVVVTIPPVGPLHPGGAFGLSVKVEDDTDTLDTDYNGPVSVSVAAGPKGGALGGTLTAMAVDGVASFTGLTPNVGGSYTLQVSTSGAAAAMVALPLVTATMPLPPVILGSTAPPPEIVAEQVLTTGKGKHKKIVGFKLIFNAPLDAATARSTTNYSLTQSMKRGRENATRAIRLRGAFYQASNNSVSVLFAGTPRFAQGGQLVVNGSGAAGIMGATGVHLDGSDTGRPGTNGTFKILADMRSITRVS
jgi:virginiamycin B lyase